MSCSRAAAGIGRYFFLLQNVPFLLFLGYNAHFAPSVCMSAFSIKVQQHNEEAEMNMSAAKSIFASHVFRMFINSSRFLHGAREKQHVS